MRHAKRLLSTLLLVAVVSPSLANDSRQASLHADVLLQGTDRDRIRHLLNRTTFGATPSLIEQVAKQGIDAYLAEQLDYRSIADDPVEDKLQALDTVSLDAKTLVNAYYDRIKGFQFR